MAIPSGTKLGSYEVTAPIGAGGMGEVYQARDTKLGRDVAIKVLPEAVAHDAERLSRFQREAKMLAALNHPNIATIHGLEQSGGTSYLVMELVPGETLQERVKREGRIPIEEALTIAKQIAEALQAAHEKGIIHRDLKPANVKVTPEGKVKVLDFGLAKAFEGDATSEDLSNSPTLSRAATMQGVILGTAAYMSPEQARGKTVDKRTDIWAFGAVLYELLTGKEAFTGEDVTEILASVVKSEPDWARLPKNTPSAISVLMHRCLRKDRRQRISDAADVRIEIEDTLSGAAPAEPLSGQRQRPVAWMALAALLLLSLGAVSFVHFRETPRADSALNLSVPIPGNAPAGFLALSPDGRRLVLSFAKEGKSQLSIRPLDSPQLQLLPGTENARAPFWSPDGKSIGFFANGKLETIPATGGPPQVLCDGTGIGGGGTWNSNGVILFGTAGIGASIQRVNSAGGACTAVTMAEGDSRHAFPEFLPDGKHFVYLVRFGDEAKRGLYLAALDNPTPHRLLADDSSAVFAPSTTGKNYGYLLFLRGSALMAQPFSAETLQLAGDVFPVATEASFSFNTGAIAVSATAGGILVYETNNDFDRSQLTWLDRSGKELGKVGTVQNEYHVALSPDGRTAATTRRGNLAIWLYDVQRGGETRLTSSVQNSVAAVWSPDGKVIAFGAGKGLYVEDANGGSKEELLLENQNAKTSSDWSRDGRYLIYTETDLKGQGDIWYLPDPLNKSAERKPVLFQGTPAVESEGQLSPDGRWLAYVSNESGKFEVYVRPFPSGPGRWKVSAGDRQYAEPRWRQDGKELFFVESQNPSNQLMAVAVQSGPRSDFQAGAPQALFEFHAIGIVPTGNSFLYSPSADGQRFLVHVQPGDAQPTVNVFTNWEKAALGNK